MTRTFYDQDLLNKLSFPHPIEGPHKIWLWLAQAGFWEDVWWVWTADGWQRPAYTLNSPMSLKDQRWTYSDIIKLWARVQWVKLKVSHLLCTFILTVLIVLWNLDETARSRNQYNQISHPAPDTKWGKNTKQLRWYKVKQHKWKAKTTAFPSRCPPGYHK